MKLKLVEAGSFTGKKRVAEVDLSDYSPELAEEIRKAFRDPVSTEREATLARDKEQLFLELDKQILPLHAVHLSNELKALLEDLKSKLKWEK
jgi:hypothetical protein